jgi:Secretion system C-terminal sorting domain
MQVFSMQGSLIKQINFVDDYKEFDLSNYDSGIYLLRFNNKSEITFKKLVKN